MFLASYATWCVGIGSLLLCTAMYHLFTKRMYSQNDKVEVEITPITSSRSSEAAEEQEQSNGELC
jgi:hypothetical protein